MPVVVVNLDQGYCALSACLLLNRGARARNRAGIRGLPCERHRCCRGASDEQMLDFHDWTFPIYPVRTAIPGLRTSRCRKRNRERHPRY